MPARKAPKDAPTQFGAAATAADFDFLSRARLFSTLDRSELADICYLAKPFRLPRGALIFRQGDASDGMYLMRKGHVRITARVAGDEEIELARLGAGDLMGEVSLVDQDIRSASAGAESTVSGYFFSSRHFEILRVDANPKSSTFKVMNAIATIVCGRVRAMLGEIRGTLEEMAGPGGAVAAAEGASPRRSSTAALLPAQDVLRALPLFRSFTPEELQRIVPSLKVRELSQGQVLFREGDEPRNCHIVLRGALRSSVGARGSREQVAVHGPGRLVGEIALMDGRPQPVTCDVRESALVAVLDRRTFELLRHGRSTEAFKFFDGVNRALVWMLRNNVRHTARLASQGLLGGGRKRRPARTWPRPLPDPPDIGAPFALPMRKRRA